MHEFRMTGYLDNCFSNRNSNGKVLNFFLKGDGFRSEQGYENVEHIFEVWIPELIEKIEGIPKGSVIEVTFNLFPKKVPLESGKTGRYETLRATSVTCWDRVSYVRKETQKKREDVKQIALEMDYLPYQ